MHKTQRDYPRFFLFTLSRALYIHIVRLCNTLAPISSYSSFVTHIDLNAAKLANILPPIQVKNCLFGGALILILTS